MANEKWTEKFNSILQTCQDELKKTTVIGKKMLSASRTNNNLSEAYQELGKLAYKAMKDGKLEWESSKVKELSEMIQGCKQDLKEIEKEVQKIKFPSGPQDISKEEKDEE